MKLTALWLALSLVMASVASAQVAPPAPGVELPQAYFDRIAADPHAFQFERAWIAKAQRAKEARRELAARLGMPAHEALSVRSLPEAVRNQYMVAGTVRVPAIVIEYSNVSAPYTRLQMEQQLFTGPTTSDGTIGDIYAEMSYGAITLTGDVHGWVTALRTDVYYEGGCNGLCGSAKTGQLIKEALEGVNGSVDFGQYDNDGPDGVANSGDDDGFVDFIAIIHPESGGECGGFNMWSHRWVVYGWPEFAGPWDTGDPRTGGGTILVSDYTIQPARGSLTGCGSGIIEIGVYAHEFGHAFGLPDLYDTNGGGQGIGEHGLMGSGSWQNPPNPVHMSPWSKIELGWVSSTEVGPVLQPYSIDNIEVNSEVFQLNLFEEKFSRKTFQPLDGAASLSCVLPTGAANNRNWVAGSGYGNEWNESVQRTLSYDGATHPVTLEYDASWQTEPTYDFGYLKIDVGGTVTTLASFDGTGSVTDATIDLTPYLMGSGQPEYTVIAQFTSDIGWSDEDGNFASGSSGPFKLDNISVTGGGESYFTDFETHEDGWCYDHDNAPHREYFLVENRNKAGAQFDQFVHNQGLYIWHIEDNVAAQGQYGNQAGSAGTTNLLPSGVTVECADGLNQLLLGINRGDGGDAFPGSTNNTTFDNVTNPNSKGYNDFVTSAEVSSIGAAAATMSANMRAGRFAPTLASITPSSGDNDQVVSITELAGTWLYKGGTFCLRSGMTSYPATSVRWVGKLKVEGDMNLIGISAGVYDVVWKGADGQEAVLAGAFTVNDVATGIDGPKIDVVNALYQNHPNPFNPTTTIPYSIHSPGHVTLRVYDVAGELVRTLVDEAQTPRPGGFAVVWDGRSDAGEPVASGVYLYRLSAPSFSDVKKLVLLK